MGSGLVGLYMKVMFMGKMLSLGISWPWEGPSLPRSVGSPKCQNIRPENKNENMINAPIYLVPTIIPWFPKLQLSLKKIDEVIGIKVKCTC